MTAVVLVSMPFHGADRPSIQAGLLAAIVREHGFTARTLHANLDLAARIGVARYERLAGQRDRMLGDWLFSVAAFGADAPDPGSALLDDRPDRKELLRIRHEVIPAYLDDLINTYDWREIAVAGFTCTFQQNTASFALARRLKNRFPDLVTVFGGANFDDEMGVEWVRAIDCVDYAIRGEADESFPQLLHALATGDETAGIAGVTRRNADGTVTAAPPAPPAMPSAAVPDYDEFFRAGPGGPVWIPIETARGCWWGEKHHCTFCGLNATTMRFRAKPPGRVLDELDRQARRYGQFTFAAVDNILDPGYLRTLLPELAARDRGYELFYEVKANLRRDQVRLLARAGVTRVQPGLESLSTRVLALMRKGTTAPQNVNLLRWARYYGVEVQWNLLWGFPGETRADSSGQSGLLPRLAHLQPPEAADRIWLERFSPLFTDERVLRRRPERSYAYVYPPSIDLERVAYFFEYEVAGALPEDAYDGLRRAVANWQHAWTAPEPPALTFRHAPRLLQVYDARRPGHERTHTFDGPAADVYAACSDRPARARAVRERLGLSEHTVDAAFAEFDRLGLMLVEGDTALALALPAVAGR